MSNLYKVLEVEHLTPHTFRLRTERPAAPIRAGQCFSVGPKGLGVNREYSMYSGAEAPYLDFLIRGVERGVVSRPCKMCGWAMKSRSAVLMVSSACRSPF